MTYWIAYYSVHYLNRHISGNILYATESKFFVLNEAMTVAIRGVQKQFGLSIDHNSIGIVSFQEISEECYETNMANMKNEEKE